MKPQRNIQEVMQAFLAVIPDETARETVRSAVQSTLDSARYTAPEAMGERWERITARLNAVMAAHTAEPWFPLTRQIFNGELDYRDYLLGTACD